MYVHQKPMLPCDICLSAHGLNILPNRSNTTGNDVHHMMCTVCLDSLLWIFPIRPSHFANREITGKWQSKIVKKK